MGELWVRLFNDIYLKGQLPFNVSVAGGSVIWNSMVKVVQMLKDGFTFKVGTSSSQGADNFIQYKNMGKNHGPLFFIVLWVIWCVRNEFVFNNQRESTHIIMGKIYSLLHSCEAVFTPPHSSMATTAKPRLVTWTKPAEGTVCLNVDGSLLKATNTAGYGGLIRDSNGVFLSGFYGTATVQSILFAELMAVLHGLQICWESGFRRITCFSDSLQIVNLIRDGVSAHHRFSNEVFIIHQLLAKDWEVVIGHTFREGNACADVLAKMGAASDSTLVTISTPPCDLSMPLLADAHVVVFIRE
ncbi:hypothetical protein TSUD_190600 [Trifolium subterraneum]|uniref:RNase H type-1 domain-containing protein n=1 Tax=Trifolium subterraneum TaxID=3900 RepID=A0A2Z6PE34_TRISU|nr:hypothetical protein TSUD_190600 [Trifolium subterraneum]